jgi:hypothetical protein
MKERHTNTPMREFEAVIRVRVFADEPFSLEALGDFLGAATQVNVDPERLGDGPVEGCLVLKSRVENAEGYPGTLKKTGLATFLSKFTPACHFYCNTKRPTGSSCARQTVISWRQPQQAQVASSY